MNHIGCFIIVTFLGLFSSGQWLLAAEKYYELEVKNMSKNFTGVDVTHALGIQCISCGDKIPQIPAPQLDFALGDLATIKVTNRTQEPTTLHWHGLLLPWRQDGPQFSNTKIIEPGKSHTFRFEIIQTGTYWYHSHTELQEQRGLYGAFIIKEKAPRFKVEHDEVIVISDWTNEHPQDVLNNLVRDDHYYEVKKKSKVSILKALRNGFFKEYVQTTFSKMGPMDLSDVGLDAFLINGKVNSRLRNIKHGESVRFRIINASASSYMYFGIGKRRNFTVVGKDGEKVRPVVVNEILLGTAETYDIIFTMPHEMKTFEVRAEAQDISDYATLLIGNYSEKEYSLDKVRPNAYIMDHGDMDHGDMGHGDMGHGDMGHGDMDHGDMGHNKTEGGHNGHRMSDDDMPMPNPDIPKLNRLKYSMLKSAASSEFPLVDEKGHKIIRSQVLDLVLSGNMDGYTWRINGKTFSEEKYIEIKDNEVITFRLINTTMMHHPIHLHGHFFRVLMGQGKFAPLFHTVDVAPMETVTIEFYANAPGIWFLHCHNLYHMKMGMARLIKYESVEPAADLIPDMKKWGHKMTTDKSTFGGGDISVATNNAVFELNMKHGNLKVDLEVEVDEFDPDTFEAELFFSRVLDSKTSVGMGVMYEDEDVYGALILAKELPGDIETHWYIRHDGKVVVKVSKEFDLTQKVSLELAPEISYKDEFEWEFRADLYYQVSKELSIGPNIIRHGDGDLSYGFGFKYGFGLPKWFRKILQ